MIRGERDLRKAMLSDLEQIDDSVDLYHRIGRDSAYQTVALQLRNLFFDRRFGLLGRVMPEATFHPLRAVDMGDLTALPPGTHRTVIWGHADLYLPDDVHTRAEMALPIDRSAPTVAVGEWLNDWVVRPDVKIRSLIRSTADEEVAHTLQERGKLLRLIAGTGVYWASEDDVTSGRLENREPAQEIYQLAIVAIGAYVSGRVRELMAPGGPTRHRLPERRRMIGTVLTDWSYVDDAESDDTGTPQE